MALYNWSWSQLTFPRGLTAEDNVAVWPGNDACRPVPGFAWSRLLYG